MPDANAILRFLRDPNLQTGPFPQWPVMPPMQPGAELRNPAPRPADAMAPIAEALSPTMGAYGMGQIAADTALKAQQGNYGGVAANVPLIVGALRMPFRSSPKPLRLYHGSTEPDLFEGFEPMHGNEVGPHLGTAEQANERLAQQGLFGHASQDMSGMAVMPVDATLRNPLELKDIGFDDLSMIENLRQTKKFTSKELGSLEGVINSGPDVFHEALTNLLTSKGYDSIKYRNQFEHPTQTAALRTNGRTEEDPNLQQTGDFSYIPIKRNTVKSATSGQTLFGTALGAPTAAAIYNALSQPKQNQQQ